MENKNHNHENVCEGCGSCEGCGCGHVCKKWHKKGMCGGGGASNAIYGLGIIGAVIYYLQNATTFWIGLLGIVKAIFWPAVLIYRVFQIIGM